MLYGEANAFKKKIKIWFRGEVVINLPSVTENLNNRISDFFSTNEFLTFLNRKDTYASVTIRQNRTNQSPLEGMKDI